MSTKRQRNRALWRARNSKYVSTDDMSPKIAAGLTQGASLKEALTEHPVQGISGEKLIQQHLGGEQQKQGRLPVWRAVLVDDTESVWQDGNTGRIQRNVIEKVDVETLHALRAGYMCLRCHEPHPDPFPEVCDFPGCGYPMRERQVMDVAMEFRGHDFIGPSRPITEYMEEQEERLARAEHAQRKQDGSSPMIALSRKILSPGAKKLRGLRGDVHVADATLKAISDAEKKAKRNVP